MFEKEMPMFSNRNLKLAWSSACIAVGLGVAMLAVAQVPAFSQATAAGQEDEIAKSLAAMLRAGRAVISASQARINDPNIGDKGLDGKKVLADAVKIYQETTKVDPNSIDPNSRHGKLIRLQMASMVEVVDAHQQTINRQGIGFKGFIPAVFARLVNESFNRKAGGQAEIKVTAPAFLVRNKRAAADQWENEIIKDKLSSASWPKGQWYAAVSPTKGRSAYRSAVPEYYAASCLSCHGNPKGEIDVTGYPKEGAVEGDLGGVISITLFR
jgi:cytochrome c553